MTNITADMQIGEIVSIKGGVAGVMLDAVLCDDSRQVCCPGVTVELKTAFRLKGLDTEKFLPDLLRDLNAIPDSAEWNMY